jgi:acyl-CoA synthetase (NDP forming)
MSQMIRDNLKRLLAPRHLAFVGGRSMARALKRCAEGGYLGKMWLVNPQHDNRSCRAARTRCSSRPTAS